MSVRVEATAGVNVTTGVVGAAMVLSIGSSKVEKILNTPIPTPSPISN